MHRQLRIATLGERFCLRNDGIGVGDGVEGRSGDCGRRRRVQRGRVAIPPTALFANEVAHDVLRAAVRPRQPREAEDLVGVVEVCEDVALAQAAVEPLDDLTPQPAQRVRRGGESPLDEVLAGHEWAELDDQDLRTKLDQPVERVGPTAGESQ